MHKQRNFKGLLLLACLYLLALFTKVEAISFLGVLFVAELLLAPDSSLSRQQRRQQAREGVAGGKTSFVRWLLPTSSGWRRLIPFALLTVAYFVLRVALIPPGNNAAWGVP